MSIKKGILYNHVYTPKKLWVEEINIDLRHGGKFTSEMVYKKSESTGLFPAQKYEGEIENGEPNGYGTYTGTDEGTYIGEWKNGLYHGQGKFTYGWLAIRHGYVLEGQWKNDVCHGQIITTYPDGRKFKGTWIDGSAQDDWDQIFD